MAERAFKIQLFSKFNNYLNENSHLLSFLPSSINIISNVIESLQLMPTLSMNVHHRKICYLAQFKIQVTLAKIMVYQIMFYIHL